MKNNDKEKDDYKYLELTEKHNGQIYCFLLDKSATRKDIEEAVKTAESEKQ